MSDEMIAAAGMKIERLKAGLANGIEDAVEEIAARSLETLPIPGGIELGPRIVYRRDPRELVLELRLPDVSALPVEKSVKYVHTRRAFDVKERSRRELEIMYRALLASLPLCVLNMLFSTLDADALDSA
jgi:hypothetical protein